MANAASFASLMLALEERLGAPPAEGEEGLLALNFADGQRSEARLLPDARGVLLTARVAEAHDGLPEATLRALLARNGIGDDLAGGTLRVRPGQDRLEIADVLPLSLGAETISSVMINQARAAASLSRWLLDPDESAA